MAQVWFLLMTAIAHVSATAFPEVDRITGGNLAAESQFPYVVSLQQLSLLPNHVQAHRCGGALISFQHAVTAASCLYTLVNNVVTTLPPSQYRVYAGGSLLSGDNIADRVKAILNFTVHPEHIAYPALLNDIGIIWLQTSYLNTTVSPIPLATQNFIPADFSLCNIAGWGAPDATQTVLASNQLRYTTKYIYNQNLCTSLYNMNPGTANIMPSMICAASYDIISAGCYGDQGNPLVCSGQLTGILFITNNCLTSSYPEVYTRVSNYTTWIRGVTGGVSTFRPEFSVLALVAFVCIKLFS